MRICALYSGGKDSCYALHWAVLHGFEVAGLVTLKPRSWDSMLLHYPAAELVKLHSEALGIPLLYREVGGGDEYGEIVEALREARERFRCSGLVTGALLSDYQRLRFSMACLEAGMRIYSPLWRKNQEEYMRWLVRDGFRILVVSVQAYGLPAWLAGSVLDEELVEEVIRLSRLYGFNPAFEGGEAETLVLDAPLFRSRLRVKGRRVRLAPYHTVYLIEDAWLEAK
ncbi:MAG: diphthine--ammonia ligase [Crenarchaeota archaeon]|nr:diphthine--ammonia ligase [Thermoproteota archaeon]